MSRPRILLTSVFKPFGVKTRYAEGLGMEMELFNNQVTRGQGVHSPRSNFWTYALYLMAENISIPATVLDFPSWREFRREIRKGYSHLAISFQGPNVLKVKRMAEYARSVSPGIKIVLGGYGVTIPKLREIVQCDEVCGGDGVRWLREYVGEDPDARVRHPVIYAPAQIYIYGVRQPATLSAPLLPGLGCENSCFFCSTSSKFGHRYIPLLANGQEMFAVCRQAEEKLGVRYFIVMDENFLKRPERARQLLDAMEKNRKPYRFLMFSSAETVVKLGLDFLVRLGVSVLWIGVESKKLQLAKLKGVDIRSLVRDLRARGIAVIVSSFFFTEDHDREGIEEDLEWAIGIGADMNQFAQLVPEPGTPLYADFEKKGILPAEYPYLTCNGQNELPFRHQWFDSRQAIAFLREAFRRKFERHGPAMLNVALTTIRGYVQMKREIRERMEGGFSWNPETLRYEKRESGPAADEFMEARLNELKGFAVQLRPMLLAARLFAPTSTCAWKAKQIAALYRKALGEPTAVELAKSVAAVLFAGVEQARLWITRAVVGRDHIRQPPSQRVEYRQQPDGRVT